jgi:hypothetical protein
MDKLMDKQYKEVAQVCEECGAIFVIRYCSDGTYDYVSEPCECDSAFHPVEGQITITEWIASIKSNCGLEKKVLEVLNNQLDGFICPNQSEFYNEDTHELFNALYSLVNKGILRKRNCEGLAYEYEK